jgi:hypothetical protein
MHCTLAKSFLFLLQLQSSLIRCHLFDDASEKLASQRSKLNSLNPAVRVGRSLLMPASTAMRSYRQIRFAVCHGFGLGWMG